MEIPQIGSILLNLLFVSAGIGGILETVKRATPLHEKQPVVKTLQPMIGMVMGVCVYYFLMKVEPMGVRVSLGVLSGLVATGGFETFESIFDLFTGGVKEDVKRLKEGDDG